MNAALTFVINAREEQQRYINGLLVENGKLRAWLAASEEQRRSASAELVRLRARIDELLAVQAAEEAR